jgi:hypothetical protein
MKLVKDQAHVFLMFFKKETSKKPENISNKVSKVRAERTLTHDNGSQRLCTTYYRIKLGDIFRSNAKK